MQLRWHTPVFATFLVAFLTADPAGAQRLGDAAAAAAPQSTGQSVDAPQDPGVFESTAEVSESELRAHNAPSLDSAEYRVRWITFVQIYTDSQLSRYAPGGAMGARFDLFQFGGVAGAQPRGYRIHIVVT